MTMTFSTVEVVQPQRLQVSTHILGSWCVVLIAHLSSTWAVCDFQPLYVIH
jgi:hypothetical protein